MRPNAERLYLRFRCLGKHFWPHLADFDHHVGGIIRTSCSTTDRLGVTRLVDAVGLSPVRTQECEPPLHALFLVDTNDAFHTLLRDLELFCENPLDHEPWQPILPIMDARYG